MAQRGVTFLSTTKVCPDVLEASVKLNIPVLCGVSTLAEARQALRLGAVGLKFYPSSAVSPQQLSSILYELRKDDHIFTTTTKQAYTSHDGDYRMDDVSVSSLEEMEEEQEKEKEEEVSAAKAGFPFSQATTTDNLNGVVILVAGGVTPESAVEYAQAGATHFCVGFDCGGKLSPNEILQATLDYELALMKFSIKPRN